MRKVRRQNTFGAIHSWILIIAALFISQAAQGQKPNTTTQDSGLRNSESSAIPSVIFREGGKDRFPIWVGAEMAFDESGRVNPSFFIDYDAVTIENFLEIEAEPKTGCIRLENFYVDRVGTPDRSSIGAIVRSSELVMIGKVVEAATGFVHATPSTLFAIEKEALLKGYTDRERFFVPFPRADFEVAGYRICKSDNRFAESPKVGDSVLIFLHQYPEPSESFLDPRYETSLVTIDAEGAVRLPKRLRKGFRSEKSSSPELDRGALVNRLRKVLAEEGS